MADFDPDLYLKQAHGFDPDAYLAKPPEAVPATEPVQGPRVRGLGFRLTQKAGEGALPGFNRVTAALQAATDPLVPGRAETWGPDFGTRYEEHLRAAQAEGAYTQQNNPWLATGAMTGGAILGAGLMPGGGTAAPAANATRLERAARGLGQGAATGTMYGVGDAPAGSGVGTMAAHAAGGAAVGGALGAGIGAMLPAHVPDQRLVRAGNSGGVSTMPAHSAAPAEVTVSVQPPGSPPPGLLRRAVASRVEPTKEAKLLLSEGVPLTVGLQNPRSAVGQIEQGSQSLRYTGPMITAQRDEARRATQNVILNKVLPPGMKPQKFAGEVDEAMDVIYQGFNKAYESVKGQSIYPAIHADGKGIPLQSRGKSQGAFDQILADRSIRATEDTRAGVRAFLENELSLLPNVAKVESHGMHSKTTYERPSMVSPVPIDRMLAMRSNIRSEIRNTLRGNASREDFAAAEYLKRAEQAVTDAIESQASPELSASLRAIDSQYAKYKILEGAVAKAGDGSLGFNGRQITNELRQSMSAGQMARGGGGELRQLARAYTRTFDESMSPPTGARLLTVGPLGEWVTGPLVFTMNRPPAVPGARPFRPPLLPPVTEEAPGLAALLSAMQRPSFHPAAADDGEQRRR